MTQKAIYQTTTVGGITHELFYSGKVKSISIELRDMKGVPIITFYDSSNDKEWKELFSIHISDAPEIKAILDKLVIDFHWTMHEDNMFKEPKEIKFKK